MVQLNVDLSAQAYRQKNFAVTKTIKNSLLFRNLNKSGTFLIPPLTLRWLLRVQFTVRSPIILLISFILVNTKNFLLKLTLIVYIKLFSLPLSTSIASVMILLLPRHQRLYNYKIMLFWINKIFV